MRPLVLACLLAATPLVAFAQTGVQHRGSFWATVSLGAGTARDTADLSTLTPPSVPGDFGPASGTHMALGVSAQVGQALGRSVRLGGGINVVRSSASGTPVSADVQALVSFFVPKGKPDKPSRWLVTLGFGESHWHATPAFCGGLVCGTDASMSGDGWSASAALGREFPWTKKLYIQPMASFVFRDIGDVRTSAGQSTAPGWTQAVFLLQVGVSYHSY